MLSPLYQISTSEEKAHINVRIESISDRSLFNGSYDHTEEDIKYESDQDEDEDGNPIRVECPLEKQKALIPENLRNPQIAKQRALAHLARGRNILLKVYPRRSTGKPLFEHDWLFVEWLRRLSNTCNHLREEISQVF